MTIGRALQRTVRILSAAGLPQARRDAELLLAEVLNRPRTELFSHPEREISGSQLHRLALGVRRRRRHYPLQYILGRQEFYGRVFQVSPAVLIPRPETEIVVEEALRTLREMAGRRLRGLDLGTGSGCIAITLVCEEPRLRVTAVDNSWEALQVAAANAGLLGAERLQLICGDLFGPLSPHQRFDLIVSNPPSVSPDRWREVDRSVRLFEPPGAVFAPPDGLSVYRRILREGLSRLAPRGSLVLELGYDDEAGVTEEATLHGWELCRKARDLAGFVRCVQLRPARAGAPSRSEQHF